jgi:hypothetical protein
LLYYGITCDFGNTQTVALSLPTNVSFTSASGVFLSAADLTAAAPEPEFITLFISGLIAFGALCGNRIQRYPIQTGIAYS